MTAKEIREGALYYLMTEIWEYSPDKGENETTKQAHSDLQSALSELEAIKSADGGEILEELNNIYNKPFNILQLDNAPLSAVPQFANFAKHVYNFILKAQAQERELRELKEKVAKIKNYTSLIDFLNILKVYEWTNESDIIFEVGFGDGKETKKITAEELRKDYADYNVLDYDLYHEVTDDNYILRGWIEIESFEDLCKGSDEDE